MPTILLDITTQCNILAHTKTSYNSSLHLINVQTMKQGTISPSSLFYALNKFNADENNQKKIENE